MNIDGLRTDLAPLQGHDLVVFGSALTDRFTTRSDIDIAVVTREPDAARNRMIWRDILGRAPQRYDVRVYELLPLPMQIDIADHHKVVFGDPVDISWYFYGFRRRWKDQAPRVAANRFTSVREKRDALRRANPAPGPQSFRREKSDRF